MFATARQRRPGMDRTPAAAENPTAFSQTPLAVSSAWTGSSPRVAAHPQCTQAHSTSAPDVGRNLMELRSALEQRRKHAVTPLCADVWEHLLGHFGLLEHYPHIPNSIRFGFYAGVQPITSTFAPPNSPAIDLHPVAFAAIIEHEFERGRYVGPLSRASVELLIGPFQSSPLSLVPKPHKPNKFRLVQNLSFPRSPSFSHASINSAINSDDYPSTWGTFTAVSLLLWRLPPGSQVACRDVAEAYRMVPLAPSQWPGAVVRLSGPDSFAIDTCNMFGLSSAAGVYGNVADAEADILRGSGIGPLTKWVDDHLFIRILRQHINEYNQKRAQWRARIQANGGRLHDGGRIWFRGDTLPDGRVDEFVEDMAFPIRDLSGCSPRSATDRRFSYCFADIDAITSKLGIPWEPSKDIPFSSTCPFTGFLWDLEARTVSLTTEKRSKYLAAITDWQKTRTHTLEELQKLYGKLLHTCSIVPAGRSYLTELEAMLGIFHDSPHKPRTPPARTADDLEWWKATLSKTLSRPIPGPVDVSDIGAYSDASSGVGIAIVISGQWRAWRLLPGWRGGAQRDIGWAEAVGFELVVYYLTHMLPSESDHLIFGDNKGVVEGWWNGRSRNREVNKVFRRIHSHLASSNSRIHSRYVASKHNPADGPSRAIYPPSQYLLPAIPIPPALSALILNFDDPPHATEASLAACGRLPTAMAKSIPSSEYQRRADINRSFECDASDLFNDERYWWD